MTPAGKLLWGGLWIIVKIPYRFSVDAVFTDVNAQSAVGLLPISIDK